MRVGDKVRLKPNHAELGTNEIITKKLNLLVPPLKIHRSGDYSIDIIDSMGTVVLNVNLSRVEVMTQKWEIFWSNNESS